MACNNSKTQNQCEEHGSSGVLPLRPAEIDGKWLEYFGSPAAGCVYRVEGQEAHEGILSAISDGQAIFVDGQSVSIGDPPAHWYERIQIPEPKWIGMTAGNYFAVPTLSYFLAYERIWVGAAHNQWRAEIPGGGFAVIRRDELVGGYFGCIFTSNGRRIASVAGYGETLNAAAEGLEKTASDYLQADPPPQSGLTVGATFSDDSHDRWEILLIPINEDVVMASPVDGGTITRFQRDDIGMNITNPTDAEYTYYMKRYWIVKRANDENQGAYSNTRMWVDARISSGYTQIKPHPTHSNSYVLSQTDHFGPDQELDADSPACRYARLKLENYHPKERDLPTYPASADHDAVERALKKGIAVPPETMMLFPDLLSKFGF